MSTPTARLAVFFDGTDNTPKDRTNVWRTHELLADTDVNGVPQHKVYIKGVGTDVGQLASGSIFGVGMARKIREGYEWLVDTYVDGAEIFVFGFSRGAFAARSLVQLIATCGLTRKEVVHHWTVEDAFGRYETVSKQDVERVHPIWRLRRWQEHPEEAPSGHSLSSEDDILLDDTKVRVVKIKMAGLWDTVGALGTDAIRNRSTETQKTAAHNVRPTRAQEHGYHALAIDEHRPMFEATLWRVFAESGQEDEALARYQPYYEQRWFVGAHSDVGGGYGDDRLPDLSLAWMLGKASALGLTFTYTVEPQPGSWHGEIHNSFQRFAGGALQMWENVLPGNQRNYRQIAKAPREVTARGGTQGALCSINETIDESVLRRWTEDPTYRPPSLVDFFRRHPDRLAPGTSLAQRTTRIYANKYWNETGVYLRAGASYRATIVPRIGEPLRDGARLARVEGEDWDSMLDAIAARFDGKRLDGAKWFALVGTVDKEHAWAVRPGQPFGVTEDGQLVCYFNDVQFDRAYANNSGWIVLDVEEVPRT